MAKTPGELHEERRNFVNMQFQEKTKDKSISNPKKTKLLKTLWKKAKREIK